MSEEISLLLEETNKLRIKAGLSPIPTTSSQLNEEVREVISLSIEETNKLRQKIGLPLLPTTTTTTTNISSDSTEYKNYEDYERERLQNLKNNQLIERINIAKFNSNKRKFLTNETIIDNAEDLDTDDWLNNLGESTESSKPHKKQKTTIVKSNQNDTGPTTTIIGHTTKELQSLGNNEILTLKDTDLINDDDEDGTGSILMNQDLSNKAKLKRNLAERKEAENIKFNGRHYRRNNKEEEEEEEEEFNDIDGLLTNNKVIMSGSTIDLSSNTAKLPPPPNDKKKNMLAITNLFEDLDNVTLSNNNNIKSNVPIKMKKIKKKKDNNKKKSNKLKLLDDTIKPVELLVETNIGNDDDDIDDIENQLSNSISNLRTKKLQTRLEFTPEQLAEEISANKRWEFERKLEQENLKNNNNNNNVYNDTIGFLNNLETNILSESGEVEVTTNINEESADDDEDDVKQQEVESKQTNPGVYSIVEEKQKEDEAPKFSGGLAETLKFLKSRNILDPESITTTNEELRQQELAREEAIKKSELLKMKISIEERILKEELSKDKSYIRMPKIERSGYFEKLLDTRLKQKGIIIDNNTGTTTKKTNLGMVQNNLKIYNPKVELTYKDELGNVLNTKQAYKQLSHKYHGTGLDKNKKKQEQLKKQQQQQRGSKSTNTSTTSTTVTERVIN